MDRDKNLDLVDQSGGKTWHREFLLLSHADGVCILSRQENVHFVETTLEIRNKWTDVSLEKRVKSDSIVCYRGGPKGPIYRQIWA